MNNHNPGISKLSIVSIFTKNAAVLLICFLVALIPLTGCSSIKEIKNDVLNIFASEKELDSAVKTVEVFFNHIINNDFEKAYDYIYISEGNGKTFDDFIEEFSDVTQIVSVEINWVEVKNNIAIVGIDLIDTYDDEEKLYKDLQVSLVKDDNGEWKINFW